MRVSNGESRGWIWKQRWKHVTLIGDIRLGPTPILPLCPAGLRKGLSLTRSIIHRIASPHHHHPHLPYCLHDRDAALLLLSPTPTPPVLSLIWHSPPPAPQTPFAPGGDRRRRLTAALPAASAALAAREQRLPCRLSESGEALAEVQITRSSSSPSFTISTTLALPCLHPSPSPSLPRLRSRSSAPTSLPPPLWRRLLLPPPSPPRSILPLPPLHRQPPRLRANTAAAHPPARRSCSS